LEFNQKYTCLTTIFSNYSIFAISFFSSSFFFPKFVSALDLIISEKDSTHLCLFGLMLYGFGIQQDEKKAFSLFQNGSEMNHPFSIRCFGYCF
jgi:hypothetical protein